MKIQLQRPSNNPKPAPKKKRNRNINIDDSTYLSGVGIWTRRVERGRRCQLCRRTIEAGEPSLRYIRDDMVYGKFGILSEKAICPDCAIPRLQKMLDELKLPIDQTMFIRMKRNQPQPQTEW